MKTKFPLIAVSALIPFLSFSAAAENQTAQNTEDKTVEVHKISTSGVGDAIGTIKFSENDSGLVLLPNLKGLTPGTHGIHIHTNPSCEPGVKDGKKEAGHAAGGHYDPQSSNKHEGPKGSGHHGDLPVLNVAQDGSANQPLIAPRLKLADVVNRTVIIHEGGDNYSDQPKPLGGGAGRIACGIIQ
jgi:Cu-Zn family superoxide dismutase